MVLGCSFVTIDGHGQYRPRERMGHDSGRNQVEQIRAPNPSAYADGTDRRRCRELDSTNHEQRSTNQEQRTTIHDRSNNKSYGIAPDTAKM